VLRDGGGERGEEVPHRGNGCGCGPSSSQLAPVVVGVGGAGPGGGGGVNVGVPQVWPAERPVEEAMLVVPGVEGWWVEGGVLFLGKIRRKEEEEEGGG
jgi:hypothetical protein